MTLDEAWAEAEAALPEGWELVSLEREGYGWSATADDSKDQPYGVDVEGYAESGPTPVEALCALAAALRTLDEAVKR